MSFIWSYNIRTHYESQRQEFLNEDFPRFRGYLGCESQGAVSEEAMVLRKFLINDDDEDTLP